MHTRQPPRLSPAQHRSATLCRLVLTLATLVLSGCTHNPRETWGNGDIAALLDAQASPIGVGGGRGGGGGAQQVYLVVNDYSVASFKLGSWSAPQRCWI